MHILIVGSGISACVTAWYAVNAGHHVTLVSKGSDPRCQSHSEQYSATWNGAGGRFITPLEARPYADRAFAFERTVYDGGWLAQPLTDYSETDQAWLVERREQAPLHNTSAWDYYRTQGSKALKDWRAWRQTHPRLFEEINLQDKDIVRLYDREGLCDRAMLEYQQAGVSYGPVAFPRGLDAGHLAKALATDGFAMDAPRFCINLFNSMDPQRITLWWETEITSLCRNEHGEVMGVDSSRGLLEADHYVLLLGAYSNLTPKVSGVAGCWLCLPALDDGHQPLKIHGGGGDQQAYDLSVIPLVHRQTKQKYLAVGGGYVFVGTPPYNHACQQALEYVEKTHRKILQPLFGDSQRIERFSENSFCVRAFTINDLPLTETLACVGGGKAVLKGGTNTGTASLAPVIADEVMDCVGVEARV